MCVTNACSTEVNEHTHDIVALPKFSGMVARRRQESTEGPLAQVALIFDSICVEPASYQAAPVSPQSADWRKAMKLEFKAHSPAIRRGT
jgi:hypothetical protein